MNENPIAGPMKWLTISFVGTLVGVVILYVVAFSFPSESDTGMTLLMLVFVVLTVTSWTFLICLGKIAKRTGRSWIVWCGLVFITSPIGWLVAYPLIRSKVQNDAKKTALTV